MSMGDQSDWYGKSPNLPSVVPATSEVEFETSLSSVYKVIICANMFVYLENNVYKFTYRDLIPPLLKNQPIPLHTLFHDMSMIHEMGKDAG